MQTLIANRRNNAIDIAKFICLFLMVYCHIPMTDGKFHACVYSFHMPLFFFVGGLFFNPTSFSLKKGLKTLILPYIYFNLLIIVLDSCVGIISHDFNIATIVGNIKGILIGSCRKNPYGILLPSGASWFLIAYFFTKLSMRYIFKQVNIINTTFVIAVAYVVILLRDRWNICIWNLDSAALGLVFFYFAYAFRDKVMYMLNNRESMWLLLFLIPLTCISWINGQVDMFACIWGGNSILFFLFAFVGIIFVLLLGKIIEYYNVSIRFLKLAMNGSIFIICMNLWLIDYISLIYRRILHVDNSFLWYEKFCITLLIFLITMPCVNIMMKCSPSMLGKNKK